MFFTRPAGVKYVDRGDPENYDFVYTDLIRDGAFHDLDLSGIIPKGRPLLIVRLSLRTGTGIGSVWFKPKGMTYDKNSSTVYTQLQDVIYSLDISVYPNADGFIEYYVSGDVFNIINIIVRGWFV